MTDSNEKPGDAPEGFSMTALDEGDGFWRFVVLIWTSGVCYLLLTAL